MEILTQKQRVFTEQYFKTRKATESAIVAGYSRKTAHVIASENLTKPKIIAYLEELNEASRSAAIATVQERKQILTEIMRARMTDYMICSADGVWMHDIGEETLRSAALSEVQTTTMPFGPNEDGQKVLLTKVKLLNPIQAITELNKMDGAYAPEKSVSVNLTLGDLTDEQLLSIINGSNGHKPEGSSRRILEQETG